MRAFMTIIPMSLLIAQTLASDGTPLGYFRELTGGWPVIKLAWSVVAVLHTAEAIWVSALCKRHQTGFLLGVRVFSMNSITLKLITLIDLGCMDVIYFYSRFPDLVPVEAVDSNRSHRFYRQSPLVGIAYSPFLLVKCHD